MFQKAMMYVDEPCAIPWVIQHITQENVSCIISERVHRCEIHVTKKRATVLLGAVPPPTKPNSLH